MQWVALVWLANLICALTSSWTDVPNKMSSEFTSKRQNTLVRLVTMKVLRSTEEEKQKTKNKTLISLKTWKVWLNSCNNLSIEICAPKNWGYTNPYIFVQPIKIWTLSLTVSLRWSEEQNLWTLCYYPIFETRKKGEKKPTTQLSF